MPDHELGDFHIWMVSVLCLKLFIEYKAHKDTPTFNKRTKITATPNRKEKMESKTRKIKGQKQPSSLLAHN